MRAFRSRFEPSRAPGQARQLRVNHSSDTRGNVNGSAHRPQHDFRPRDYESAPVGRLHRRCFGKSGITDAKDCRYVGRADSAELHPVPPGGLSRRTPSLFRLTSEPVPLSAEANTGGENTQPAGFHWKAGAAFRLQQFVVPSPGNSEVSLPRRLAEGIIVADPEQ